jgi:tetratricopeptide (TPR) repeat protein
MSRLSSALRFAAIGILAVVLPVAATASEVYGVGAQELDYYQGNRLLTEWRVGEARQLADRMLAESRGDSAAKLFDAHVRFFEGDYDGALAALDGLGVKGGFRELVRATAEAVRPMKSRESEHFVVFWGDPKDEVLADMALESLETARTAIEKSLGYASPGKVRLEIYPTVSSFTAVSTLTRKEVATSGTIGLCKFDRIMITSPRATAFGYRWRDTLCHEYVHLVVYRLSAGSAPIWVHEGVAKYFEGAWRGRIGHMDAQSLALLAERHRKGTLISLEKMSPSVAKLPSAEDTALAFAEVGTMMRFLTEKKGEGALAGLVRAMGSGADDRAALESVWGGSFDSFYDAWNQWAGGLPPPETEVEVVGPVLREDAGDADDPGAIPEPEARDFARLGDMLRGRGRMTAAAIEYEKGFRAAPKNPAIASRHALGRLAMNQPAEALRAVEGVLDLYDDRGVLWVRKGDALRLLKRPEEAVRAYRELLEINPFDLQGRMGLLDAATAAGDTAEAERQHKALAILEEEAAPKNHP